jgi:hypothetical protein
MGEWEDFHEALQVFRLLQTVAEPVVSGGAVRMSRNMPDRERQLVNADFVVGHLARELQDAVRVQAFVLGIELDSVQADVSVLPLVQASAEVCGDRPWIRYRVMLDTTATAAQLLELHIRVQSICVQRLECEYETPIAGNVVNTRAIESAER